MLASKFRDDAEGERDEIVSVKNSWKTREAAENQALKWNDWTLGCTRTIVLKSTKPGGKQLCRGRRAKVGSHGVFE